MTRLDRRPAMGLALIEATRPLEHFDFTTADRWHVVVLADGIPVARVELASPGRTSSPHLARAAILRHADRPRERERLVEALDRRLGVRRELAPNHLPVTVAVCTHGRPQHLPRALDALAALHPAPAEVIVVDNAPGDNDCRDLVEARGFRYVREDSKGLDIARNAAVAAATGAVVAFTDDDCVPAPAWLRFVDELFARPQVAAVTGPALPFTLDSETQVAMERHASLGRGLNRLSWDWTSVNPANAGQVGVGANMLYRRTALNALGPRPFPPELDAGTGTESGGDTYVLSRILASGARVIYDPGTFVFHVHRTDHDALDRAVFGYGCGITAMATKLLVEDGELEAPRSVLWLWQQLRHTARQYLLGRADEAELRIAWRYVAGGLVGPSRWLRSRRSQRACHGSDASPPPTGAPADARPAPAAPAVPPSAIDAPPLTVVVPTIDRPGALARCLAGLAAQTVPFATFEVIVVDDAPMASASLPEGLPFEARLLESGSAGAARARNLGARAARGRLLLFLDDDLVPEPELVAHHLAAHDVRENAVVMGHCPPRPVSRTLAALGAELWWEDHFDAVRTTPRITFSEALSGNTSVSRALFLDHDGFPDALSAWRREDWAWGLLMLEAGIEFVHEPGAVAFHEFELTAASRLRAAYREARGDLLLSARWPVAFPALPVANHRVPTLRTPLRMFAFRVLGAERGRNVLIRILAVLERRRLRHPWMHLHNMGQRAAYAAGLREGGLAESDRSCVAAEVRRIDLCANDPIGPPAISVPYVELHAAGAHVQRILPPEGHWGAPLVREIARTLEWPLWRAALPQRLEPPPAADPATVTIIVEHECSAAALRALGVTALTAARGSLWLAADALLRNADTPYVGVLLDSVVPNRDWLDATLMPFDGDRVAVVIGEVYDAEEPEPPTLLHDRDPRALPFLRLQIQPAFVVLRRDAAYTAGGFHAEDQRYGEPGPLLGLLERLLADDHVVAERSSPELGRSTPSTDSARRYGLRYTEMRRTGLRMSLHRMGDLRGRDRTLLALRTTVTAGNDFRHLLRRLIGALGG